MFATTRHHRTTRYPRRLLLLGAVTLGLALIAPASAPGAMTPIDYPDFSSTAGLTLDGTAAKSGDVLRLSAGSGESGSAFSTTTVDPSQPFHTGFTLQAHGGTAETASMAFILRRGPAMLWVAVMPAEWPATGHQLRVALAPEFGGGVGPYFAPLDGWSFGQPLRLFVDFWPKTGTLQVSDASRFVMLTTTMDVAGGLGGPSEAGFIAWNTGVDQDVLSWHADAERRDRTEVWVEGAPEPSGPDEPVTFRAAVNDAEFLGETPSGTVQLLLEGEPFGAPAPLDASGVATVIAPIHTSDVYRMRAAYHSDTVMFSDSLGLGTHYVGVEPTETQLAASTEHPKPGTADTFTVLVRDRVASEGVPTGAVQFKLDGVAAGNPVPLEPATGTFSGSTARLTIAAPAPGIHVIAAEYIPDRSLFAASSASLTQVVDKSDARVTGRVAPDPTIAGQDAVFSATVAPVAPATATPTGTVQFTEQDATPIGEPEPLDSHGRATIIASAGAGTYEVHANYSGDATFTAGSTVIRQVVRKAVTRTTIASDTNPVKTGAAFGISVHVGVQPPGDVAPDGLVELTVDGQPLGEPIDMTGYTDVDVTLRAPDTPATATIAAHYGGGVDTNASSASLVQVAESPTSPVAPASLAPSADAAKPLHALANSVRTTLRKRGLAGLRAFKARFVAPQAGRLEQTVYTPTAPQRALRGKSPRPLARGTLEVRAQGPAMFKLRLTPAGRRAVRRGGTVRVAIVSRFTPVSGIPTARVDRLKVRARVKRKAAATGGPVITAAVTTTRSTSRRGPDGHRVTQRR